MSVDEKLQKCIEFIRRIERGDIMSGIYVSAEDPRVNGDFICDDCGSRAVIGSTYVELPGEIRDMAWHLLADVDGL